MKKNNDRKQSNIIFLLILDKILTEIILSQVIL